MIIAIKAPIRERATVKIPTVTPTRGFPVPEPMTVYVEIKGSMFNPLELKIVNGTTVKWTNADSVSYIVNVDDVHRLFLIKEIHGTIRSIKPESLNIIVQSSGDASWKNNS